MRNRIADALAQAADAIRKPPPLHRCRADDKTCLWGPCPPKHCAARAKCDAEDAELARRHEALCAEREALDALAPQCPLCGDPADCLSTAYDRGYTTEPTAHGDELYQRRLSQRTRCVLAQSTVERNVKAGQPRVAPSP